jgi:hypothetical protein
MSLQAKTNVAKMSTEGSLASPLQNKTILKAKKIHYTGQIRASSLQSLKRGTITEQPLLILYIS